MEPQWDSKHSPSKPVKRKYTRESDQVWFIPRHTEARLTDFVPDGVQQDLHEDAVRLGRDAVLDLDHLDGRKEKMWPEF